MQGGTAASADPDRNRSSSAFVLNGAAARVTRETTTGTGSSLTSSTAQGFLWLFGNTVGSKVVNVVGNIALAWLLLEEDFGLIGLAYTFTVFSTMLSNASIRDVLVHRHTSFRLWSNAAFWMTITIGIATAIVVTAMGPIAAMLYDEPRLIGLIAILSLNTPLGGLAVVSESRLHAELRFRTIAVFGVCTVTSLIGGKVALAWLGYGAYSFAIPEPAVRLVRSAVIIFIAPPIVRRSPQLRRWKYLIGDSMRIIGANALTTLTVIGDCFVLGLWHGTEVVGLYYFALRNSSQTIHLFTQNMASVLFPSLNKLKADAPRQTQAFLRASRVLALAGVPFCFLQAGLADPVVRLLFEERWYPSIPVLQILSIGMALRLVTEPSYSMLKAQGRFGALWKLTLIAAVVYYAFIIAGALCGGAIGVSVALALWLILFGPIQLYVAIRAGRAGMRDVARVYGAPVILGGVAVGAGAALASLVPATFPLRVWFQMAIVVVTTAAIYIPLIRRSSPGDFAEVTTQVRRLARFPRTNRGR